MRKLIRKGAALLCLCACILSGTVTALGRTTIDTDRETSLTIQYSQDRAISNVRFSLYRVAEVSEYGEYVFCEDFKDYGAGVEELDTAGWQELAQTLNDYVKNANLPVWKDGITDAEGRLHVEGLNVGLYLVLGEKTKLGRTTYTPAPFLVQLPGLGEDDQWIYDLTEKYAVYPKYQMETKPGGGGGGDSGGGDGGNPPTPSEPAPPTVPEKPDNPSGGTGGGDDPADPLWSLFDGMTPRGSMEGGGDLPQTGMLWWPVPLLAGVGLVLFTSGWISRRKEQDGNR